MRGPISKLTTKFILSISTLGVASTSLGFQIRDSLRNKTLVETQKKLDLANQALYKAHNKEQATSLELKQANTKVANLKGEIANIKADSAQHTANNAQNTAEAANIQADLAQAKAEAAQAAISNNTGSDIQNSSIYDMFLKFFSYFQ